MGISQSGTTRERLLFPSEGGKDSGFALEYAKVLASSLTTQPKTDDDVSKTIRLDWLALLEWA